MKKTMKDYLETMTFDEIIDVRETEEYQSGHINGALNIPLGNISQCQINKQNHIAVYCRSGARSQRALDILKENGFVNVTNIGGVMDESVQLTNE